MSSTCKGSSIIPPARNPTSFYSPATNNQYSSLNRRSHRGDISSSRSHSCLSSKKHPFPSLNSTTLTHRIEAPNKLSTHASSFSIKNSVVPSDMTANGTAVPLCSSRSDSSKARRGPSNCRREGRPIRSTRSRVPARTSRGRVSGY